METRNATAAEVRKHYVDDGYEVRISQEGHVTIRADRDYHPGSNTSWRDGRYVSEYRVIDGQVVLK